MVFSQNLYFSCIFLMLMRVFALYLYLCYTLSIRNAKVVKVSNIMVLQQITFLFGVTLWCCSLNPAEYVLHSAFVFRMLWVHTVLLLLEIRMSCGTMSKSYKSPGR